MEELNRKVPEDTGRFPAWLLLDSVRSMHNVGSAFRTADAFNVSGIFLTGFTPRPPHRDIHKTALGATETVPWKYEENVVQAILQLKEQGYRILGVEQTHNSTSLEKALWQPQEKTALIFGNEVTGVSHEALTLCDGCIEIPQWGSKHSLNISVSLGIVLWELVKRQSGISDE